MSKFQINVSGEMGRKSEQNYKKLRKYHKELGVPWTDSTFPANDSSIGLKKVS